MGRGCVQPTLSVSKARVAGIDRDTTDVVGDVESGVVGGGGIVASNVQSEAFERRLASGMRIYNGGGGFDFDDLLYLLGPAAWLGWLAPILVGASIGAPVMALISWMKLRKLRAHQPA